MAATLRERITKQTLDSLRPFVLTVANYREGEYPDPLPVELKGVQANLVRALEVIVGERPGPLFEDGRRVFDLPLKYVLVKNETVGRLGLSAGKPTSHGWNVPHDDVLYSVVAMMKTDNDTRRRLRRCDDCKKFFMQKGSHRRAHSFCSENCRRRFDNRNRDPEKRAEYMRRYRLRKKKERERDQKKS